MKRVTVCIVSVLAILFGLNSCFDDFSNDFNVTEYNPNFSLPIGPLEYRLSQIMPYDSLPFKVSDTLALSGGFDWHIIAYDDSLYAVATERGYKTQLLESIDLGNFSNESNYVDSLIFRANISNEIPAGISIDIYFLDAAYNTLDRLNPSDPFRIERAGIDENYNTTPTFYQNNTPMGRQKIENIQNSSFLLIDIFIETYIEDLDIMHLNSSNNLKLQFGIQTELTVPLDPDSQ